MLNNRFLIFFLFLSISSCIPHRDIVLFRNSNVPLPDLPATTTNGSVNLPIQANDALSITVSAFDPALAAPFNLVDVRSAGFLQSDSPLSSYLVDSNGDIDLPVLGKVQAAKRTIPQLRDTLIKRLKPYIKEPTVTIRRVNFRVTVMGEVARPGAFFINSERITVLEAIGLAGDLTPYSDRRRVLVIRETNGKINSAKLDLQSADFFKSPYYYLQQNDVVYVDPKKNKRGTVTDPANEYVTWWSAGISAISTIITVFALLRK